MMPDQTDPEGLPEVPYFPWERASAMLAGELTASESNALMAWIHEDPERERLFASIEQMWREGERITPRFDATRALEHIRARATRRPSRPAARLPIQRGGRQLAWAAALLVCVGLGGFLARGSFRQSTATVTPPAITEVATVRGQRAIVQLSDGSRVTLGVASTLRYKTNLDTATLREVELDGEAYFEVPHDSARPFVVRTKHGVARDLGTKFSVRAYGAVQQMDVVVAEGLVSLKGSAQDSLLLARADLGRIDAAGRLRKQKDVDVRAMLAWTRGELVFSNTPVGEVISRLNMWYDGRVVLADSSLATVGFTSSFGSESLATVVRELAAAIGARVESRNGEFILRRDQ